MMKMMWVSLAMLSVGLLVGCQSAASYKSGYRADMAMGMARGDKTEVKPDRMLIWEAQISLDVWNVSNAGAEAVSVVEKSNGYVERKSDGGETSASMTLRIPAKQFKTAVAGLEELGTVTYRSVEGKDVTDEYVDVEARLKNKKVLRDRLQKLLDKAADVKEVLAIETELNRVQGDIDSMEARIKSIKGSVDYATVNLDLNRRKILGPVGYVLKGCFWGIGKLFVIRE